MIKITRETWYSASGPCSLELHHRYIVDFGSSQKKTLAKGLGVVIGECIFALNGPFLFGHFGLNVPEAASVGCLVGAAVGYGFADLFFRIRNRRHTG
jgi:hypothetical protein